VPFRAFLNAVGGYSVRWDSESKAAAARSSENEVTAPVGQKTLTVNGISYQLQNAVYLTNGVTYVPLRIFAGALGYHVYWDRARGGAAVDTTASMPAYPYTEEDLYWLSRVIYAESGAESLEGQIAVGNVVLNRLRSAEYPNSIYGVIFDTKDAVQFEPTANGTIYNTPSALSVTAAKLALRGNRPVGESLYFYAPALSQGTWINANCTYVRTVGCHRFYR
ncbi:MAG: cell wall hydrolase, partial [Oscillospiraceae bacterium]|nr:cell wall hydrolase [Oscillospiraceae bacterium]